MSSSDEIQTTEDASSESVAKVNFSAIDTSTRHPLMLLISSALAWLVLSAILGIFAWFNFHSPGGIFKVNSNSIFIVL